jgi:hypothetical protein
LLDSLLQEIFKENVESALSPLRVGMLEWQNLNLHNFSKIFINKL